MNKKSLNKWNITAAVLGAAIGWACLGTGGLCRAQTVPADLSPDVQEVLTLSKQHMDDSVITNYIFSTGKSYKLSADDIIYLNGQGVSQPVISALLQTGSNANAQPAAAPAAENPAVPATAAAPAAAATPPPLDESSPPPADNTPPPPAAEEPPPSAPPAAMPSSLVDNFYTEGGLNGALWQTQTPLLASLAAMNGAMVQPEISFSPSGMQMSGTGGPGQFMGIQSAMAFNAPFSFSVAVIGMAQDATPFDIYFVSPDLQQYLSIDGHLGGRGVRPRGAVTFWGPLGGVRVPTGSGNAPDYGIWVNHTGSGQPVHALGERIFDHPIAGVPYTVQVSVGPDGEASVTVMDAHHGVLGSRSVPVGTGPFYVVLAGRDGPTYAVWQSVTMTSTGPPVAMEQAAPAVAVPPTPTMDYFQGQLTPYGNWVNEPGYGLVWQPAVSPGWRPYYDGGHWEYTDAGYFWQSDYPWGDITFHYGRWAYTDAGWVWVPGYDYAPAWVVWRHDDADGYVGWAPLPPGAVFVDGGWRWHGAPVAAGFDFGLGVGFFTFVGYDHFWAHNYRPFIVPHDRLVFAFGHSVVVNHYRFDHGVFVNVGLPHDRMVVLTHHDFRPVAIHDLRHDEEVHHAMMRNDDVHNFHPGGQPNAWGHPQGGGPGGHPPQGNQGGHQQGGRDQNNGGHQNNGWGH